MSIKLLFVATVLTNTLSYPVDAGVYDSKLLSAIHYSICNTDMLLVCLYTHHSTQAKSDTYSNVTKGIGHSYLQITNGYSEPVFLQGFKIKSNHSITVGLWGTLREDPMPNDEVGTFINREAFYYSNLEDANYPQMLMATTTKEKLYDTFDFIREKAFTYDLLSYNCTHFATDMWYKLVGQDIRCGGPYSLMEEMDNQDEYTCINGRIVSFSTDCFYSYYKTPLQFKKYTM